MGKRKAVSETLDSQAQFASLSPLLRNLVKPRLVVGLSAVTRALQSVKRLELVIYCAVRSAVLFTCAADWKLAARMRSRKHSCSTSQR